MPPGKLPSNFDNDDEKERKKSHQGSGVKIEVVKHKADRDDDDQEEDCCDDNFVAEAFENLQLPFPKAFRDQKQRQTTKYAGRKSGYNPFLAHLANMTKEIRNPKYLALCMDDELKRMESHSYGLTGEDLPTIRYPQNEHSYDGPILRPNIRAYEMVAKAYARGKLGKSGATLAEDVVSRFIKLNPSERPSPKLLNYVMKAWIAAGDLDKVQYWLYRIEDLHKHKETMPDYRVYLPFLNALNTIKTDHKKMVANLSILTIEKMRNVHKADPDHNYLPSRDIYMTALMNIRDSQYNGEYRFDRGEKLLRYRLEDYKSKPIEVLKPTASEALPVFIFAGSCSFPRHNAVIEKTEKLLYEFKELYKETGDPDFRPVPKMYERVASMHARMSRRKNVKAFAEKTYALLEDMAELGVEFENNRTGAAMLNRVMETAEYCMPTEPLSNPVRSRDMFAVCLDAFKKLHEYSDSRSSVQPNSGTYEVFLRAVAKLPEGESRTALSSKAFDLCRQRGLVSAGVCQKLYKANPALALSELDTTPFAISEESVAIPENWRLNVVERVTKDENNIISSYKEVDTWASMDKLH
jgi:hypothetical protein